ncbi:MAG: hypothetical protein ABR525_00680 [Candidatus Limnocylindria bacterium]
MTILIGADLAPQRPRFARERPLPEEHILEPEWAGRRALVRVGHPAPRFVGYDGALEGPRELYDAITADARASTAIIDGVLVADWEDERDLEVDAGGNAFVRTAGPRTIFAAFDLLEVDGESLLEVPLLERKRHLEGILAQSMNVRLTPFVARGLRAWQETLQGQGFKRVVLKDWNSAYRPGETAPSWTVVEKLGTVRK